jgi:hypothetical protein
MELTPHRAIDQELSEEPLKGVNSAGTMIKPAELIDVAELVPLTLADRRIWDMLIVNAWDRIGEDVEHVIALKELQGSHNVNDRVQDSVERMMGPSSGFTFIVTVAYHHACAVAGRKYDA